MTIDGVSGIYQGNSLRVASVSEGGPMPDRYKGKVVFQVTKVGQNVGDGGWETKLTCMMRLV